MGTANLRVDEVAGYLAKYSADLYATVKSNPDVGSWFELGELAGDEVQIPDRLNASLAKVLIPALRAMETDIGQGVHVLQSARDRSAKQSLVASAVTVVSSALTVSSGIMSVGVLTVLTGVLSLVAGLASSFSQYSLRNDHSLDEAREIRMDCFEVSRQLLAWQLDGFDGTSEMGEIVRHANGVAKRARNILDRLPMK